MKTIFTSLVKFFFFKIRRYLYIFTGIIKRKELYFCMYSVQVKSTQPIVKIPKSLETVIYECMLLC